MKYLKLTVIHPDNGDTDTIYIREDQSPMGIMRYDNYTILNFGSSDNSILVEETPEEVMSLFGATLEERFVQ